MEQPDDAGSDDTFYQTVIRFAEDVVVEGGMRTDPDDVYDMAGPTPPRWEADYNGLHITLHHGALGKHEPKPYGLDHASQKHGRKTVCIRPEDQLLDGIVLSYCQTVYGELDSIDVKKKENDLLRMELQEYAEAYR